MKNLTKLVLTSMVMIALTLVACGGGNLKAIDEKIEKQGIEAKFSSGEYDAMIGFVEKLLKEDSQIDPSDEKQMEKIGSDYGKMFSYMMVLEMAEDNGDLSASQIKKFEKIKQMAE